MMLNWLKSFSTQLRTVAYIIIRRFLLHCSLDTIGQETEDGTSPQKHGETTKHLKEKREQDLPFNSRTLWNSCHNLTSTPNPPTISKQGRFWSYLFAEFDPLWGGWRRSEGVGSITGQDLSSLLTGQPLTWENTETECYKKCAKLTHKRAWTTMSAFKCVHHHFPTRDKYTHCQIFKPRGDGRCY